MKLDNSNKRISNIIAGILLVFIALVFIATALGVIIGYHLYNQDNVDPLMGGSRYNLEDNGLVPVAQYDYGIQQYNTVPGTITQVQEDLVSTFDFPLCIDPTQQSEMAGLFNYWYKVYQVCGGYEPDPCGTQQWNLYQWDKESNSWVQVHLPDWSEVIGWSLTWVKIEDTTQFSHFDPDMDGPHVGFDIEFQAVDCCCYDYWVAIIDWQTCENKGCIDSNRDPYGNIIPGKHLELDVIHAWTGCGDADQQFVYILVQISRIPNSRINT
jgi:hypothetical protein